MKTFIFVISLLSLHTSALADNTGVIRSVQGDVKVQSAKTGQTGPATVDQNVVVTDVIITGSDGRATVVMDDLSAFRIGPNSSVEIRKYISSLSQHQSDTLLNLMRGSARFLVVKSHDFKKTFEVHTPQAVCGVRGTDFVVEYSAEEQVSKVTTIEGVVEFSKKGADPKPVRVLAGMRAQQEKEKAAGEPKSIPAKELKTMKNNFAEGHKSHERHEKRVKGKEKHH